MLITCKNCNTIFSIDQSKLTSNNQKVKCSVCSNVWIVSQKNEEINLNKNTRKNLSNNFLKTILVLGFLFIVVILGISQKNILSAQLPFIKNIYISLGFNVGPNINALEIVNLKTNYHNNYLRIYGEIKNNTSLKSHASLIFIKIYDSKNNLLKEIKVRPDNKFIEPKNNINFFYQSDFKGPNKIKIKVQLSSDLVF